MDPSVNYYSIAFLYRHIIFQKSFSKCLCSVLLNCQLKQTGLTVIPVRAEGLDCGLAIDLIPPYLTLYFFDWFFRVVTVFQYIPELLLNHCFICNEWGLS